jgi:hypothetical protein
MSRGNNQGLNHLYIPNSCSGTDVEDALRMLANRRQVNIVASEQLQHKIHHVKRVVFNLRDLKLRELGLKCWGKGQQMLRRKGEDD